MKSAPHIWGLFLVDQREFRKDMHAAVDAHQGGHIDLPWLEKSLYSHMERHGFPDDHDLTAKEITRLAGFHNYRGAHKLLDAGIGDYGRRRWVNLAIFPARKLFWPTLAVVAGLAIYHWTVGT